MGRHADALRIYPEAIATQKSCQVRMPRSVAMRDLLSKMYYNYGRSLRAENQWDEAVGAALARRELWSGNSDRLLGVAVELAELNAAMTLQSGTNFDPGKIKSVDADVLATLQLAYDSGWPRIVDLEADEKYACFKQNERFASKIAEFNRLANRSRVGQATTSEKSPASAN
jgi:hypothetical protein